MSRLTLNFKDYETANSKFLAVLAERGGIIHFSNSGRGGAKKWFSLGVDSFLQCLKDIRDNLTSFQGHEDYVEREWRDLGSQFYTDNPANAQCTVQTKPMFVVLSKLIMWANGEILAKNDPETTILLGADQLRIAIEKVERLAELYAPKSATKTDTGKEILIEERTIRDFAFKVFQLFYQDKWNVIKESAEVNTASLNTAEFNAVNFAGFNRLFAQFDTEQNRDSLSSSGTLRYFEDTFASDDDGFYYFSTQWTGVGENSLSFGKLKEHFESQFPGYTTLKTGRDYILVKDSPKKVTEFKVDEFISDCVAAHLINNEDISRRLVASLLAKRFLILTGLSGSGKTKLAQAFVRWICISDHQYIVLPVASDWTNREPLFGYPNALSEDKYVRPESGVVQLILNALENPEIPHFLILDEMNLSHVERYFADFLSGLESGEAIPLHTSEKIEDVPQKIELPNNLFVIGTVNIDETTYMFSPKVLDRANVIEFRVSDDEIAGFLDNPVKPKLVSLERGGVPMGASFVDVATRERLPYKNVEELNKVLQLFFGQLKLSGAEFGYRSAYEIHRLAGALQELNSNISSSEVIDICIMQKLLPKVHGSRRKLEPILKDMVSLCVDTEQIDVEDLLSKPYQQPQDEAVNYPLSLEKLHRMYRGAIENGFTSYAEA